LLIIKQAFWTRNSQLKLAVFKDQDGGRVPAQGEGRRPEYFKDAIKDMKTA